MKNLKEYFNLLERCLMPGEYKIYFNETEFIKMTNSEIKLFFAGYLLGIKNGNEYPNVIFEKNNKVYVFYPYYSYGFFKIEKIKNL
jgi:hypothetical protein